MLRDAGRQPVDDAVVLWFPGPAVRPARTSPNFTFMAGARCWRRCSRRCRQLKMSARRSRASSPPAFENGKLDLTEAEALDDLIHADTDRQRRQALRQLKGLLGDKARDWRAQIIEASALIEAGIDFSDEGDVPAELIAPALAKIEALLGEIRKCLRRRGKVNGCVMGWWSRSRVRRMSASRRLMNQLARREVAIVSPHAGTTRDIIEVQLDLDGYPVTVIDTAGIRETDDPVEQEGVRRARARAAEADLVLWLVDAQHGESRHEGAAPVWMVRNKIDLDAEPRLNRVADCDFAISASRGDGMRN